MARSSKRFRRTLAASLLLAPAISTLMGCSDGFVSRHDARERQDDYLAFATAEPLRPQSTLHVLNHLERAHRDPGFEVPEGAVPADAWAPVFAKLYSLRDTSDFDLLYLMNLVYAYGGHPAVPAELWAQADQAMLDFKYWYTDPTPDRVVNGQPVRDDMWYWTENHVLLFKVNEYLAGQRHPDEVFSVTGQTGAWHRDRAKQLILRWLDERARWGFTEWHSDVYYQKDVTPLLTLVEWAEDEELSQRASMVLDLVMLDMALHLHRGNFGATHGRSYVKDKPSATKQDTFNGLKLLFDDTPLGYGSTSAADASLLARARKYRLPRVIAEIASDDAPLTDRERMNIFLDEVPDPDPNVPPPPAPYGLDFADEDDAVFFWTMGSQTLWQLLPITLEVGLRENLFEAQLSDFKPLLDIVYVEGDIEATLAAARPLVATLWPAINQSYLGEVNTYTHRTADYMLSTAQDYRKGVRGSQTHISQATFSEHAVAFVQQPGYLPVAPGDPVPDDWNWQRKDEPGPGYWTGSGSEPRAAQFENVSVQIFAPQYPDLGGLGFGYRNETHAYLPHAHFDEVVQEGPWTFARKDDGYLALYSHRPTEWREGQPEVFENAGLPFDLVAPGSAANVWIMECAQAADWAGFEAFRQAIAASPVEVTPAGDVDGNGFPDGFDVRYASPSQGTIEFGWSGPLVVGGVPQAISGYPRMQNRFASVGFDETLYEIEREGVGLRLDFAHATREAWEPRPSHDHPHDGPDDVPPPGDDPDDSSGLQAQLKTWLRGLIDRLRHG
jgi:hypothetical protein